MPTFARLHLPGALVHLMARIVDRRFLIAGADERAAYLARIPVALARCDWTLLAYAIMSNHIHLVLIAGHDEPARFLQSLHISYAAWLNHIRDGLGPVFAARPRTIYMPLERAPQLVSYVHNNPVRAQVVDEPEASDWTSHRSWLGTERTPPWLAVHRGLSEAGFDATPAGRVAFGDYVGHRRRDPRSVELSGEPERARSAVRALLALPVELSSTVLPTDGNDEAAVAILHRGPLVIAPRWEGDLDLVVELAARQCGLMPEALRSRVRLAEVVRARRMVVVTIVMVLRRRTIEAATVLGISAPAVSQHLRQAEEVMEKARRLGEVVRSQGRALAA